MHTRYGEGTDRPEEDEEEGFLFEGDSSGDESVETIEDEWAHLEHELASRGAAGMLQAGGITMDLPDLVRRARETQAAYARQNPADSYIRPQQTPRSG